MADVGEVAGVSAQTVSRFFTGGYLSDASRQRVQGAITELGYRRNRIARNLRAKSTDTIGVLAIGPVNFGGASILAGLNSAARAAGISLITTQLDVDTNDSADLDEVLHALDTLLTLSVDGIILGSPYLGMQKVLEHLKETVPILCLSVLSPPAVSSVAADSYRAGVMAMEHLVDLGHRRILHLAGPADRIDSVERVRAYEDVIESHGLDPLPIAWGVEWTADAGASLATRATPSEFTAVFAGNDLLALGFGRAMALRGYEVPRHFSLVGIDDMPEARYFTPSLSSINLNFVELGSEALKTLLRHVHSAGVQPHVLVEPILRARDSTRTLPRLGA